MKIYLDSDFKCHATDNGTMTAAETDAFDGKYDNNEFPPLTLNVEDRWKNLGEVAV